MLTNNDDDATYTHTHTFTYWHVYRKYPDVNYQYYPDIKELILKAFVWILFISILYVFQNNMHICLKGVNKSR